MRPVRAPPADTSQDWSGRPDSNRSSPLIFKGFFRLKADQGWTKGDFDSTPTLPPSGEGDRGVWGGIGIHVAVASTSTGFAWNFPAGVRPKRPQSRLVMPQLMPPPENRKLKREAVLDWSGAFRAHWA